jgi:hypothetical protein
MPILHRTNAPRLTPAELEQADIDQALTRLRTAFADYPQLAIWTSSMGEIVSLRWQETVADDPNTALGRSGPLASTRHYLAVTTALLDELKRLRECRAFWNAERKTA